MKHPALLIASALAAVAGLVLILVDAWTLVAVHVASYRRWPVRGSGKLPHAWLWYGVLPVAALILLYVSYRLLSAGRRTTPRG